MKSLLLKALQLALIADQEYAAVQASPTGATTTLLAPNNFDTMVGEIAQIFATAPAVAAVAPAQTPLKAA